MDEIVALLVETPLKTAVSEVPGATPPVQLAPVDQVAEVVPSQVKAELDENAQLILLPPSVTVLSAYSLITVPVLLESVMVALSIAGVLAELTFQRVPGEDETTKTLSVESVPLMVSVPETVVVDEAAKVQVLLVALSPSSFLVRLLKVVLPVMDWSVPSKVTVPDCAVKVPELDQFPASVMA